MEAPSGKGAPMTGRENRAGMLMHVVKNPLGVRQAEFAHFCLYRWKREEPTTNAGSQWVLQGQLSQVC